MWVVAPTDVRPINSSVHKNHNNPSNIRAHSPMITRQIPNIASAGECSLICLALKDCQIIHCCFPIQLKGACFSSSGTRLRKWSKLGTTKHEMALFKMAGLLLGYFALAWVPTQVFVYIATLCPYCSIDDYIRYR